MRTINAIKSWRALRASEAFRGRRVGFVPTMGALHAGHLSLVGRSLRENDVTVVSVFVNPTQFNDKNDLKNYPRPAAADAALLRRAGVHYLLAPRPEEMYPDGYRYRVTEGADSALLCGAYRPGHFDGVLTVVLKLLNLVKPRRAYFGEKDYQQYRLLKGMAEALFLDAEIVPCPIVREADGLALSSRNLLLTPEHRRLAPALAAALRSGKPAAEVKRGLKKLGFEPDYVEDRWGRRFAAARLGKVRLIDNVEKA